MRLQSTAESILIDGQWQGAESGDTFEATNPATGDALGQVADGGAADTRRAIEAADRAFRAWSGSTAYERSDVLREAHRLMLQNQEALADLMTTEQGKPIRAARIEVKYAADFLMWFAEEAKRMYGRLIPSARADQRFIVSHQAIGVVAAITPWNYPISMITRKAAPALAAGCTVVLKPAEQTPLCAIETVKLLVEAGVPAGVLNLVTTADPAAVGGEMLTNRAVRKLTFTGSTEVGKLLARGSAEHLKRVSLELGGHAPFIVFEDADPVHAAKGAVMVKTLNTGQACISPNRIYVHESIHDEFIAVLKTRMDAMRAGDGHVDGVSIGPLIDEDALRRMERQVQDAVAKGAELVRGGSRLAGEGLDRGCFFDPTILARVDAGMQIYREETFGPIAAVTPFTNEDEVVAMANDTDYGLASYIYTNDLSRAWRVAEALRFGMVGVNDINPTAAAAPFGGIKESGLGREGASEGLLEYLDAKLVGMSI